MPCVRRSRCCRALGPDLRVLQRRRVGQSTPGAIGAVPGVDRSINHGKRLSARALQTFRQRVARHPQGRGHALG